MASDSGKYINQNAILVEKQRELAKKYGIPLKDIQEICNLPFGLLKETIEVNYGLDSKFESMKIPGFLTFFVKDFKQEVFLDKVKFYISKKKLEEENIN